MIPASRESSKVSFADYKRLFPDMQPLNIFY